MFTRAELKDNAKQQLKGNWLIAVLVFFCYTALTQLTDIEFTYSISESMYGVGVTIIGLLIYGPLTIGVSRFSLKLAKGDSNIKFKDLFSGFDVFLKSLIMNIIIMICVFVGTILFIIPGVIVQIMFSQANYILAENPEKSFMECLKESSRMMKGYKMDYFILELSFIGWAILSLLTFGIGFLWLIPYFEITVTNFYLKIKK